MKLPTLYKVDSKGKVRTFEIEVIDDKYRTITGTDDGKKITTEWTTAKPMNVGRSNATTAEEQALKEAKAKWDKKLASNYYDSKDKAVTFERKFFEPMLAIEIQKIGIDELFTKYGSLLVDPKLDGMRFVASKDSALSRRGKPVPAATWIVKDLLEFHSLYPSVVLDGELYNHDYRDNFEGLMSLARKQKLTNDDLSKTRTQLKYYIYDMYDQDRPDMSAEERKQWLDEHVLPGPRIQVVRYEIVTTKEELNKAHELNIAQGYEGSIVRIPSAAYKNGRSKNLLKYKSFKTAEFPIIDIVSGKGNRSEIAGTVFVRVNGATVGCSIKGSWEYARQLLEDRDKLIGKDATIRFFDWTSDGSLRFPVCIDVDRWENE